MSSECGVNTKIRALVNSSYLGKSEPGQQSGRSFSMTNKENIEEEMLNEYFPWNLYRSLSTDPEQFLTSQDELLLFIWIDHKGDTFFYSFLHVYTIVTWILNESKENTSIFKLINGLIANN